MQTFFVEMAGPGAEPRLRRLAAELAAQPACLGLRLLESREQAGLYLLELEWQGEASPALPADAKVWRFRALAGP